MPRKEKLLMTRLFTWNNAQNVGFLIVLAIGNATFSAASSDFQYFGAEIDYWHEKKTQPNPVTSVTKAPEPVKNPPIASHSEGSFPWQTYMDPKNKEFFKEGDYTPPEPFMEIVRNPSDANLKLWFDYINKKNELVIRVQERMRDYLVKNSVQLEAPAKETMNARLAALPVTVPDAKRYRFRMYFDSHCPHCKKMFGTLSELQAKGFYVEAKQVDSGPLGMEGANIPSSRAAPGELKEKNIKSVPVLLIGDLQKKEVFRLTGYQTASAVFSAIQVSQK